MGILLRVATAGTVVGAAFTIYVARQARNERRDLNIHSTLIDSAVVNHPDYVYTRLFADWSAPRMPDYDIRQGGFSNLYFDLTIDAFNKLPESVQNVPNDNLASMQSGTHRNTPILFIAPPSFVSSRTIFFDMAFRHFGNFAVTELPSYGLNKQNIRPEHYTPTVFESALATLVAQYRKQHSELILMPSTITNSDEDSPRVQPERLKGVVVIAAGHAAFSALKVAQRHPELFSQLVLLNPTFRGPLPTVRFDLQSQGKELVASALDLTSSILWKIYQVPYLGDLLHKLFTSPETIKRQLESHVFVNKSQITDATILRNQEFALEGPILGKCAFLVGRADPLSSRQELTQLIEHGSKVPTLCIMGAGAPDISRADLEPLRTIAKKKLSNVTVIETKGALRSFEEFPSDIGDIIHTFVEQGAV
eukprot:gene1266-4474_t